MAYRADIEIGVKGVRYLDELQNKLTQVSKSIEQLNRQTVVVRRTIAGAASAVPMGPGGAGVTSASAQAAAFAVEKRVSELRRADMQTQLKSVKDRAYAENYISNIINKRLQTKQKELQLEQKITAEQKKQAASAQQKRIKEATSNAIIGGAFPLLFGQGIGAAVGGGLGGAAGGLMGGQFGFGLSLVGTALGTAVDTFTTSAINSGKALRDPIENFSELADKGLLASRSQKQYIEQLIEAGRITEAVGLVQAEVIKKVGVDGLRNLQNAGAASDKLNKALAELSLQAQAAVAGPLAALLSWLAGIVAIGNNVTQQAAQQSTILQGLSGQDKTALQKEEQRILAGANIFNEAEKRKQVEQLYKNYASRSTTKGPAATVNMTAETKAKAETAELQAQVTLEAKKLSLTGMSLEKNGQAYVTAAKAVALQEYENQLLEIKNNWVGKAYDAERNTAMIRLANLQYAGKLKAIDAERVKKGREQRDIDQSLLGLQIELVQTTLSAADADIAKTAAVTGEIASLKESVQQQEARLLLESRILDLQLEQKLLAKDITQREKDLLEKVYYNQKANLQAQTDTKTRLLQLDIARLETARQLAALEGPRRLQDINQQRAGEIANVQLQLANPFGGSNVEQAQQYMDQQMRFYETITPLERELSDLQVTRSNIAAAASTEELNTQDRLIADKKAEIDLQRKYLTELNSAETTLLRQQQVYQKYGFIVDDVSRAFSDSISGIITGTTTVAEAFQRMFESIGKAFIDMATQLLAQKLFMTVLNALAPGGNALGSPQGSGGGILPGGWQQYAFAEGGFVTGPTRALIGEGGQSEYVIPANKMRGAMSRYAAGARGSAVIPAGGDTEGGGTATMAPASIDVRYTVERINSVDYVTADQFQAGLQQAAAQGAERGQQLALRRLQQSPSTRRRVGI